MKVTRAVVPTLFTVLNMFCGFLAIIQSSEGNYIAACWLIILAGIFDALDGMMARLTKSISQFGVEIESVSDVVSFGAAPAYMVWKLHLFHFDAIGVVISSLLVIMGGIRLARFNVQLVGFSKEYFTGLPIPSAAYAVIFYIMTFAVDGNHLEGIAATLFAPLVVVISLLMVSKIKYDTLPKISKREIKKHRLRFIAMFLGFVILLVTRGQAMFYLFMAFILFGIFRSLFYFFKRNEKIEPEIEESPSYDL